MEGINGPIELLLALPGSGRDDRQQELEILLARHDQLPVNAFLRVHQARIDLDQLSIVSRFLPESRLSDQKRSTERHATFCMAQTRAVQK